MNVHYRLFETSREQKWTRRCRNDVLQHDHHHVLVDLAPHRAEKSLSRSVVVIVHFWLRRSRVPDVLCPSVNISSHVRYLKSHLERNEYTTTSSREVLDPLLESLPND